MKTPPTTFKSYSPLLALALLGNPLPANAGLPADHLIARWMFETGIGSTVLDSSGNAHHGIITGSTWSADTPSPADSTWSLSFIRTEEDYIDTTDFDINDDFTISLWINPHDLVLNQNLIGKHTASGGNLLLVGFYNNAYHVRIRSASTEGGVLRSGWQHLLVTGEAVGDNTRVTFYRNGLRLWQEVLTDKVGDVSGGKAWTMGQDWDSATSRSDYFDGGMDDVRIYDRALTEEEIKDLTAGYESTCNASNTAELETQLADVNCDLIQMSDNAFEIFDQTLSRSLKIHGMSESESVIDAEERGRAFSVNSGNSLHLRNLTIQGGSASTGGGAIQVTQASTLELDNTTIQNSQSTFAGGGIYLSGAKSLKIRNSTMSGNTGGGGGFGGGGIYAKDTDSISIQNSTLSNNTSPRYGGGIHIRTSGITNIDTTTFSNNSARGGGGIRHGGSKLIILNSTISSNSATRDGGGVSNYGNRLEIESSTVTSNSANKGGGLYGYYLDHLSIRNSLFTGNRANSGGEVFSHLELYAYYDPVPVLRLSGNLIGDSAQTINGAFRETTRGSMPSEGNTIATSNAVAGPDHQPSSLAAILDTNLANNGGPTRTHALRSNSIARDNANNEFCQADDQRGQLRNDDVCDIGAFEFKPTDELNEGFSVIPLPGGKVVVFPN